jgi:uncharacterized protein with PIN domain/sulfur carrier protein ThiS
MLIATIYFHGELNDFLRKERRWIPIEVEFNGHETVKHLIEASGVPHPEVEVILINGESVEFGHQPDSGDRIEVYPSMHGVDVPAIICLKPFPLKVFRFVLDSHLGKLATYLRLLGFDTWYQNNYEDTKLAEISHQETRILLTRDRGLLKRTAVRYGYCVREKSPPKQLTEIVDRFDLASIAKPFSRCANCNGVIGTVEKEKILDRLGPKTKRYYNDFRICDTCDQIYWKGSHFDRMEKFFNEVLNGQTVSHPKLKPE